MAAAVVCTSTGARASTATEAQAARASELFTEGKHELDEGHFEVACAKLAESDALDPQVGTKMNLARCYEQLGKTASACAVWREAAEAAEAKALREAEQSERQRQEARRVYALSRVAALDPQISRVSVTVVPSVTGGGVTIRLDGSSLPSSQWGQWLPVDPGAHRLDASSPGRRSWSFTFQVDAPDARMISVSVPALEPIPDPSAVRRSSLPHAALASGAIAVGSAAVGTIFGALAVQARDHAAADCAGTNCNADGVSQRSHLRTDATVSDVAFGVAGAATLAAVTLWLLGARREHPATGLHLSPALGSTTGLSLRGEW